MLNNLRYIAYRWWLAVPIIIAATFAITATVVKLYVELIEKGGKPCGIG